MFRQLLIGGGVSLINIAIHAVVMTMVVQVARLAATTKIVHPALFLMAVMIPTVSVWMVTHTLEVMVWSLAYWTVGAAPSAPTTSISLSSITRRSVTAISFRWNAGGCWAR